MAEPRWLRNIRILDFSWFVAGPLTTRMFSNFGAEVIKVESANRLDAIRSSGAMPVGGRDIDHSGVFMDCNAGKRSVTLNLNHPRGREMARELVAISDVVTNNFTFDRMDRWGLGYSDLKKVKSDIIVMTMPAMGSVGPYRHYLAYGNSIIAAAGLNSITGFPDRLPVGTGPAYSDFVVPYQAFTTLLAALCHRDRTGQGQFIDFGQYQSTVSLLGPAILDYTANGNVAKPSGNRRLDACPHGVYRCLGEDKWCAIAVETDDQWPRLCEAIGRPELADDRRFSTVTARKSREDEVEAIVGAWTLGRTDVEVMERLQDAGVPAGVVQTVQDMVERDCHIRKRHFQELANPSGVTYTTHGEPLKVMGRDQQLERAPALGEHNEYVIKTLLGLSDEEAGQLVIDGVLY